MPDWGKANSPEGISEIRQEVSRIRKKMPAPLIWVAFTLHSGSISYVLNARDKGRGVYDKMRKLRKEEAIFFVVVLQTDFLTRAQEAQAIV